MMQEDHALYTSRARIEVIRRTCVTLTQAHRKRNADPTTVLKLLKAAVKRKNNSFARSNASESEKPK
jgi:hypothetical protein